MSGGDGQFGRAGCVLGQTIVQAVKPCAPLGADMISWRQYARIVKSPGKNRNDVTVQWLPKQRRATGTTKPAPREIRGVKPAQSLSGDKDGGFGRIGCGIVKASLLATLAAMAKHQLTQRGGGMKPHRATQTSTLIHSSLLWVLLSKIA